MTTGAREDRVPFDAPQGKGRRPNPLAARLARRAGCLGGRVALVLAILLGPLTSWFVIKYFVVESPESIFVGMLSIVAISLTIGAVLSLPLFVASTSARLTVSYAQSQEYPLLFVTTLPDGEIVNGHVFAILRHIRAPLVLVIGLAPAYGMVLRYFGWLFTSSYYSNWTWYDGMLASVELGVFGTVLKYAIVSLALGLALLGISVLATALGVGFGLWWRSAIPAASAALVTIVVSTLLIAYVVLRAMASLDISDAFLRHLLQCALFAPCPYVLALGCMRLARRWVRKPG